MNKQLTYMISYKLYQKIHDLDEIDYDSCYKITNLMNNKYTDENVKNVKDFEKIFEKIWKKCYE